VRPPIVGLFELQCSPVAGTVDEGDGSARCCAERVLFAFGPMLRVLSMCRGVVAVDATHLTGTFKSTLYAIVGKDASNHLVPCSFMLSWRSETSDDWVTFLTKMKPLMPHVRVCISDYQKGLRDGVAAARWRHSRCVLHMLRNMRGHGICGSLRARDVAILARQCRASDYNYVLHTILTESKVGSCHGGCLRGPAAVASSGGGPVRSAHGQYHRVEHLAAGSPSCGVAGSSTVVSGT
jgi:hypothetical protein